MQITRQADYAIRAVRYLSTLEPEKRVATREIADKQEIPASFLAKIISQLTQDGILDTSRGAKGGVFLAKKPEEISLLEVVEAIDRKILLNVCVANSGKCSMEEDCPMKPIWCDAQNALVDILRSTTFDQFAN